MLQDQLFCIILKLLTFYIIDAKIKPITSNYRLKLTSINVNLAILDKFTFEILNRIQQISTYFLLFLLEIAAKAGNCYTI